MYYALHNTAGIIRKVLKGPSLEWAELNRASEDELIFESETEINNGFEKVEDSALVDFVPVKSPEEIQAEVLAGAQRRLDDFARTRNYDGILSACTYATSTVPQFAAEGQHAVAVRDQTWAALYQMLAEVQTGTRPMPAGYVDIEAELPALEW